MSDIRVVNRLPGPKGLDRIQTQRSA